MNTDTLWRFPNGHTVDIKKMQDYQLYPAAIECYKRMFGNQKQSLYAGYRAQVAGTPNMVKYWTKKRDEAERWLEIYADKLEAIDERASEIGIEISDDIQELRSQYASIRKDKPGKEAGTDDKRRDIKDRNPKEPVSL